MNIQLVYNYDTLVLSGGSTKGIIILGALQYAIDNNMFNINTFIGTSVGSMICYLLAIGYSPKEIIVSICLLKSLEALSEFNITNFVNGYGAVSFSTIQDILEKLTISKIGNLITMNDLKQNFRKTLICTTYNLTTGKTEYISYKNHPNLSCIDALHMSSNLPLIFEKFKYNDCYYVDGGISDNFSIDLASEFGNKVLGILLDFEDVEFDPDMNILEYIYKLIFIPITHLIEYKIQQIDSLKCDVVRLKFSKLKFFNFDIATSQKLELFSYGYQNMKNYFSEK